MPSSSNKLDTSVDLNSPAPSLRYSPISLPVSLCCCFVVDLHFDADSALVLCRITSICLVSAQRKEVQYWYPSIDWGCGPLVSDSTTWRGDSSDLGLDLKRLAVSFARAQPGQLSLAFWETFDCVT